ncbi:MAG TPA: arylsulfatase [Clostridiales bacterium]|nr:arylsulfatase [Clostridiales bacterium]
MSDSVMKNSSTAAGGADELREPCRPNIILMLADDLGYGDLSCYGASRIHTPKIDLLCSQGVRFSDAHAPAAVCQPTRYGILAGRYYWRAERKLPNYTFQENEILLPRVLKDNGYDTAAFGKWHLGWGLHQKHDSAFWNGDLDPGPNTTGFDYYFGMPNTHSEPPFVFIENNRVYRQDPEDPVIITEKRSQQWKFTGEWGGSTGAKAAHEACDLSRVDLILAERASEYIRNRSKHKPFFIYLPFFAPHVPLLPSEEFRGTSQAGELGDFIQQQDKAVGIVLRTLEECGQTEDTLVIFTSDNGGIHFQEAMELGHRSMGRLLGQKTSAWEGGHRVPFMARWPGRIPAGTECDKLLCLTDLFATFMAAAGIPLPKNAAPDSVNQLPMLEHPADTPAIRMDMVYTGKGSALRSGDWVYMPQPDAMSIFGTAYMAKLGYRNSNYDLEGKLREDAEPAQLYNIKEDAEQTTNLYRKYTEIAKQMEKRLKEIIRQRKSR